MRAIKQNVWTKLKFYYIREKKQSEIDIWFEENIYDCKLYIIGTYIKKLWSSEPAQKTDIWTDRQTDIIQFSKFYRQVLGAKRESHTIERIKHRGQFSVDLAT